MGLKLNRLTKDLSAWRTLAMLAGCTLLVGIRPDLISATIAAAALLQTFKITTLNRRIENLSKQHQESEHAKRLLTESIECAPLAFALYGTDDRLLAWNGSYEKFYPDTFAAARQEPGALPPRYVDLLRESVPPSVPANKIDEYIEQRVNDQRAANGKPVDRHYPIAGWNRVTKFVTPSGAIAGFAVDISALKAQEAALQTEIERRQKVESALKVLATTDSLTGAINRRAFMESIANEIERFKRYRIPACLVLLDVDWFKSINDRFGHQSGDEVLTAIVNTATESTRSNIEKIGRIGGEEFGLLLPHTKLVGAQTCANQLREAIAAMRFKSDDGTEISVTASFGISQIEDESTTLTSLIGEADRAMYESKAQGRNQVTVFGAIETIQASQVSLLSP